ncbi:hypothetical protein FRAAL4677 [Frankia alni ACN14a]|uniref:Uncharacterized protein n=1 Tax=Frankia alni (strain DSM 45986 / CECT 9034 / ACN14a) TaxID=326424 RepID=Q0RGR7_FRAAA|nr:hypothetical protein FRAAL4677 [Frankia alni ACN14a]
MRCWLLIGWAHVGPGLLQAMHEAGQAGSTSSVEQSISAGGTGQLKAADDICTTVHVPVSHAEPESAGVPVAPAEVPAEQRAGDEGAPSLTVSPQRRFDQGTVEVVVPTTDPPESDPLAADPPAVGSSDPDGPDLEQSRTRPGRPRRPGPDHAATIAGRAPQADRGLVGRLAGRALPWRHPRVLVA